MTPTQPSTSPSSITLFHPGLFTPSLIKKSCDIVTSLLDLFTTKKGKILAYSRFSFLSFSSFFISLCLSLSLSLPHPYISSFCSVCYPSHSPHPSYPSLRSHRSHFPHPSHLSHSPYLFHPFHPPHYFNLYYVAISHC